MSGSGQQVDCAIRWMPHIEPVLTAMSFPLYCIRYYFMLVISLLVSPFSQCCHSLCLSASVPFSSPSSSGFLPSALLLPYSLLLLPWLLLPSQYVAIAPFGDRICFYANIAAKQISCHGGEGKHLGIVCLDIIRTQCKMFSSYTRLGAYCI